MALQYRVWMVVEEVNEEYDHYKDIKETQKSVGSGFNTQEEAEEFIEEIVGTHAYAGTYQEKEEE